MTFEGVQRQIIILLQVSLLKIWTFWTSVMKKVLIVLKSLKILAYQMYVLIQLL